MSGFWVLNGICIKHAYYKSNSTFRFWTIAFQVNEKESHYLKHLLFCFPLQRNFILMFFVWCLFPQLLLSKWWISGTKCIAALRFLPIGGGLKVATSGHCFNVFCFSIPKVSYEIERAWYIDTFSEDFYSRFPGKHQPVLVQLCIWTEEI